MFRSFFFARKYLLWSILGTLVILGVTWYKVQLDVQINEWFGAFYDLVQKILAKPGTVTLPEFWAHHSPSQPENKLQVNPKRSWLVLVHQSHC